MVEGRVGRLPGDHLDDVGGLTGVGQWSEYFDADVTTVICANFDPEVGTGNDLASAVDDFEFWVLLASVRLDGLLQAQEKRNFILVSLSWLRVSTAQHFFFFVIKIDL